jgi:FkbH-like protein
LVRPEQYEGRGSRSRSSKSFTDIGQFLKSLEMQIEIGELSDAVLPRIAQLTQKTNQFNLRTQRYTEADLTRMVDAKTHRVFWLRLADRFGDEGIVAVAVVESSSSEWFLDTLLMSCRVLGRGVEQELVRHLKSEASATGVRSLTAEFLPSGRNELVRELLPSMNFTERNNCWELDTSSDGPRGPVSMDVTITNLRE